MLETHTWRKQTQLRDHKGTSDANENGQITWKRALRGHRENIVWSRHRRLSVRWFSSIFSRFQTYFLYLKIFGLVTTIPDHLLSRFVSNFSERFIRCIAMTWTSIIIFHWHLTTFLNNLRCKKLSKTSNKFKLSPFVYLLTFFDDWVSCDTQICTV